MQVLIPGFSQPTHVYELHESNGMLSRTRAFTVEGLTISQIADQLDKKQTILVPSGHPQIVGYLKQRGFWAIEGAL